MIAGAGYAWSIQFMEGLGVTGLTNITPWGMYVQFFNFLLGVGAGTVIVSAAMDLTNARSFTPILRISIAVGAVAAVLGSVFILGDLGRPERAIYFFISPNLGSSMVWDMIFMVLFFIAVIGYGWFSMRADLVKRRSPLALGVNDLSEPALSRDRTISRIFAGATIVAGALLANQASLTSWTLTEHQVLEGLSMRILLAPMFLVSALASGVATLLLVVTILSRFSYLKTTPVTLGSLAKLLAGLVLLNLAVVAAELAILGFRGSTLLSAMTEGPYALALWLAIASGVVVPLILLAYPSTRRLGSAVAFASLLSLSGVFLIKFCLLMQGTLNPRIAYPPGIPLQTIPQTVWATVGNYVPTSIEVSVVAGVLAFGALLFTLAVKILPLKQEA
jgi:molybdopterin-containing oxidoreductase family membrane subunit